jgi:hypothetical protein
MEDLNIKNLRFPVETDSQLIKLSEKFGRTKIDLFKQMVDYFYRTKKDPLDTGDEVLKAIIAKNHHNLTGFIKTQEKELLIPVKLDMDRMIGSQKKILDCFNTQILEHNQQIQKQQTELLKQFSQLLQSKEVLKAKFAFILESYAKARDQARDKDDLLRKTQAQIKML